MLNHFWHLLKNWKLHGQLCKPSIVNQPVLTKKNVQIVSHFYHTNAERNDWSPAVGFTVIRIWWQPPSCHEVEDLFNTKDVRGTRNRRGWCAWRGFYKKKKKTTKQYIAILLYNKMYSIINLLSLFFPCFPDWLWFFAPTFSNEPSTFSCAQMNPEWWILWGFMATQKQRVHTPELSSGVLSRVSRNSGVGPWVSVLGMWTALTSYLAIFGGFFIAGGTPKSSNCARLINLQVEFYVKHNRKCMFPDIPRYFFFSIFWTSVGKTKTGISPNVNIMVVNIIVAIIMVVNFVQMQGTWVRQGSVQGW